MTSKGLGEVPNSVCVCVCSSRDRRKLWYAVQEWLMCPVHHHFQTHLWKRHLNFKDQTRSCLGIFLLDIYRRWCLEHTEYRTLRIQSQKLSDILLEDIITKQNLEFFECSRWLAFQVHERKQFGWHCCLALYLYMGDLVSWFLLMFPIIIFTFIIIIVCGD